MQIYKKEPAVAEELFVEEEEEEREEELPGKGDNRILVLGTLGKNVSRLHFEIFFLFCSRKNA